MGGESTTYKFALFLSLLKTSIPKVRSVLSIFSIFQNKEWYQAENNLYIKEHAPSIKAPSVNN